MIIPRETLDPASVAQHYDELSDYYLEVWGEHVHHGLWLTGGESPEQATRQLVDVLAQRIAIQPGERVCDIGCGYGGTARILVADFAASVTGFTISKEQFSFAVEQNNGATNPLYVLGDWLHNGLDNAIFDAAIAIESSEHMPDKTRFFSELHRVIRPGGRAAIYAWLAKDNPSQFQIDYLLEPICREGRLPGMGNEDEYKQWFEQAGFTDIQFEDFSKNVPKTWTICIRRMLAILAKDPNARRFLLAGPENRVFAKTVLRIWLAYRTGAMRYGLFTASKPAR